MGCRRRPTQLSLSFGPPTPSPNQRDHARLLAILRRAALSPIAHQTGLSPRQVRLLLRPLPPVTLDR